MRVQTQIQNQKGKILLWAIFIVIFAIVIFAILAAVTGILHFFEEVKGPTQKITISVLDAFDDKPVDNAIVELEGEVAAIPEYPTPSPKFGKKRTKNGVAIFFVRPDTMGYIYSYRVHVVAKDYIEDSAFFHRDKVEHTIRLISKTKCMVTSEELAVKYAKKNKYIVYWLENHPGFDPNDPQNYRVNLDSPYWWVSFSDNQKRKWDRTVVDCGPSAGYVWDDIICSISAKVRAIDGEVVGLWPDLADTDWASPFGSFGGPGYIVP